MVAKMLSQAQPSPSTYLQTNRYKLLALRNIKTFLISIALIHDVHGIKKSLYFE
jgi:hypothetical protein